MIEDIFTYLLLLHGKAPHRGFVIDGTGEYEVRPRSRAQHAAYAYKSRAVATLKSLGYRNRVGTFNNFIRWQHANGALDCTKRETKLDRAVAAARRRSQK